MNYILDPPHKFSHLEHIHIIGSLFNALLVYLVKKHLII